jgi:putative transposase
MARAHFIPSPTNPYHITGRAHNRVRFPLPLDEMWTIFCDQLHFVAKSFKLRVHAFVMMPNHYHLITSCPEQNLSEAMHYFMREISRTANYKTGNINTFWGGRFHRSEIRSYHYFLNAYKYVYFNPIAAKLEDRVENYKYSTLHGLLGKSRILLPIDDDLLLTDLSQSLRWLNRNVEEERLQAVRRALKHRVFALSKIDSRPHPLEFELI